MRHFLDRIFRRGQGDRSSIERIRAMEADYRRLSDHDLRAVAHQATELIPILAVTCVIASRVLALDMFDVQLLGALALGRGNIAEMKTGEGKTLAAVPAVAYYARAGNGVHVMTVNDYLARRDASWMGQIYRFLGLSVGCIQQAMSAAERRAAYACDITYATANEIGFDFLRDRLALRPEEQVHRPFAAAVIDEVDSILIDEARVPLVIAGGDDDHSAVAYAANEVVRRLRPGWHWTVDTIAQNVALTDAGIGAVEQAFACGNLYEESNVRLLTAVQDSLHAHALLRRDVDYVVKNGAVEMVDEFKGRIAQNRRWPAGLHTAIEIREGVAAKRQGRILGSVTLQHLIGLYPQVSGMTGTAQTQALEFEKMYGLGIETIPTNRPVIRTDEPDLVFQTRQEKERAVLQEIRRAHAAGQPVLAGTGSVAESEHLSRMLDGVPHQVLNARNDELEAAIVARAGERGAVTISTNMAGRGTDIRLGEGVAELGGLYVIGMNKHESRRIDNQLRGRAGRQGDPGLSRFFISLEDDLMVRYGKIDERYGAQPDTLQRIIEGQHLDTRIFLHGYEVPFEGQRNKIHVWRQEILESDTPERDKRIILRTIDDTWADYLARVSEYREGVHWVQWSGRDPHHEYLRKIDAWFREMEASLPDE